MPYLLLLANAPDAWDDDPDFAAYTDALRAAGVLLSAAGLRGAEAATAVRVRDGERLVTDGPFADTKEHLVGYYLLDLPDLDAALDWAARAPVARTGTGVARAVWRASAGCAPRRGSRAGGGWRARGWPRPSPPAAARSGWPRRPPRGGRRRPRRPGR